MKKVLSVFLFLLIAQPGFCFENPFKKKPVPKKTYKSVLAPAVQFNLDDYKNYFLKNTDYRINLKSKSTYKIVCDTDVIGVNWGDLDNIKMFDEKNEFGEVIDIRSVVFKTKYETYTYIRLFKSSKEIVNLIVSVNPVFEEKVFSLGLCKLTPYREE